MSARRRPKLTDFCMSVLCADCRNNADHAFQPSAFRKFRVKGVFYEKDYRRQLENE